MKNQITSFKTRPAPKSKQQGVALAVGIILLLIISVIGVNSMKSALLQEKMSGNLSNRNFADAAAYSLMVSVENYLHTLYASNNGVKNQCPGFCVGETGSYWDDFSSQKNMTSGLEFPGTTNLGLLLPYLRNPPRYILYDLIGISNANGSVATVGETGGGSAGASAGNAAAVGVETELEYFRIGTKANDITGNYYVVYESMYAVAVKN